MEANQDHPVANSGSAPAEATPPLPVAQRCEEISEADFDALVEIAENPGAAGRLKRPVRKVLLAERVPTRG